MQRASKALSDAPVTISTCPLAGNQVYRLGRSAQAGQIEHASSHSPRTNENKGMEWAVAMMQQQPWKTAVGVLALHGKIPAQAT